LLIITTLRLNLEFVVALTNKHLREGRGDDRYFPYDSFISPVNYCYSFADYAFKIMSDTATSSTAANTNNDERNGEKPTEITGAEEQQQQPQQQQQTSSSTTQQVTRKRGYKKLRIQPVGVIF
jgi:hypothetical protein